MIERQISTIIDKLETETCFKVKLTILDTKRVHRLDQNI